MDQDCRLGLDESVIAIDCLLAADGGVLEAVGLLLGGEHVEVVA